ncbi:DUF262 domain-containing protein [Cronobacter malonaticus]|uniref:GmrSD restriction endonuclease domain-containing protein n=1 Tax=Cronobacter malonaticus TaxID=413503 RepID=UPI000CFBEC09|nr:DUF262 domain-containing protein [Cronobacter malonaticus]MDT3538238.1 DUF262 domain-containing protein [Cronobacter malonaticus]
MTTTISIKNILRRVVEGELRIPAFQRNFVWSPDRVQFLMDSLYKGYPIGTILVWRTRERLDHDRKLGAFSLPTPKKDYPIDYILDGQQRITSIFSAFQTELQPEEDEEVKWLDIYFDLDAKEDVQNSQFIALKPEEVEARHIPLKLLFDYKEFGRFVHNYPDASRLDEIYALQANFIDKQINIDVVETEEHSKIAIIFERVNRGGVPLDTYQLLSAWTWSGDFDLRSKFEELGNELDEHNYNDLVDDPDLLLKCCAAVLRDDASAKSVVELDGTEVRNGFEGFTSAILGAIDFLRRDCGVSSFKNIPYKSMLIPLSRCFYTGNKQSFHPDAVQRAALVKWFWHSCFSRRYSNSVDNSISQDIKAMVKLIGGDSTPLTSRTVDIPEAFFIDNIFNIGSVNTKIFILLLANQNPLSLLSGARVDLESVLSNCNRNEFHHIFPKNYLKTKLGVVDKNEQFMLANFTFLSQKDNRSIKDSSPSDYVKRISEKHIDDIFASTFIPDNGLNMDYGEFIQARAKLLANAASRLAN